MGNFAENLNLGNRFRPPWSAIVQWHRQDGVYIYTNQMLLVQVIVLSTFEYVWMVYVGSGVCVGVYVEEWYMPMTRKYMLFWKMILIALL